MRNTLVLVHGFMDTGRRMGWMSRQLRAKGWKVLVPSLQPSNGTQTIEQLADQLHIYIRENTQKDERINLIAFSMGGLICRHYVQRCGRLAKTDLLITIATPHNGTLAAYILPLAGVRQMRPKSAFLNGLNADIKHLKEVTFFSYYSPFDLIILPASSSVIPTASCIKIFALIHPWIIFNRRLLKEIVLVLNQPTERNLIEQLEA